MRERAHQGRCAPLTRWPEDGPSLTAAVRDGPGVAQVGAEGWYRSNKRIGREARSPQKAADFPLPLPERCKACGKRKWQAPIGGVDCEVVRQLQPAVRR
jgi:hypothetical protein